MPLLKLDCLFPPLLLLFYYLSRLVSLIGYNWNLSATKGGGGIDRLCYIWALSVNTM